MLSTVAKVDPRVTRTRALLLEAFDSLMVEKPFEDITVQDIATRATINRATFYAHFPDKYALVDDLIRTEFAQMLAHRLGARDTSAQAHVRSLFLAVTDHWARLTLKCQPNYHMFASLVEVQIKAQLRDNLLAWLRAHITPRAQQRQNLDLAATLLSWSIYGAAMEWYMHAKSQSAEAFADAAVPLIVVSITALES